FFSKFQSIRYNTTKDYFEFAFNYKDFTNRDLKGYETNWTLCTHGIRLRNKKNNTGHWESITVDVTDDLKRLFDKHKIFYKIEEELKDEIVKKDEKSFFESLTYALKNMLAMRYSKVNSEEDYILSPVKDKNGNFYDSRKVDESMPKDADANGAYHIALKGAILLERLQNKDDATAKADLLITQQQWLAYVVEKWKS
ncbi:MAG: hypothetical protein LGB78_07030, partial [Sulfurovum sp.]|nr:hypothetical protein [Sulfurovum sp.]MCB4763641.1 hypothetical protein [Sulfurovum sp.]MCB4779279.1 hypothetical protein [Sulfurovum sp.]MCB4781072.1 hypothetical protein [Sulfurovum sp.]